MAGDVFYLRILLHNDHCRGKTSFEDLLEVNGHAFDTYQAVCRHLGLLTDDQEWTEVLAEAGATDHSQQLRALYVIILLYCQPADPKRLFDEFWDQWKDDFVRIQERKEQPCTDEQYRTMVRLDIQVRLQSDGKDLTDFGLEPMTDQEKATVQSMVNVEETAIREELDFVREDLVARVQGGLETFTDEQRVIFNTVMDAVRENKSLQLFISARGGVW